MKRILIITAIVIAIIALSLWGWSLYQKGKLSSNKKQSEQKQTSYVPPLATVENIEVKDPKNLQQIKESVGSITDISLPALSGANNDNKDNKDFAEFSYKGTNGQPVLLDDFLRASNIKIYPDFKKYLDQNNFTEIYCLENNQKSYGVIFNVGRFGLGENFSYAQVKSAMSKWESTMLQDLSSLLYPQIEFSGEQLNQTLKFRDGKYRFAEINLPDGSKSSINYKIFGDPIVITTSQNCLAKVNAYILSFD